MSVTKMSAPAPVEWAAVPIATPRATAEPMPTGPEPVALPNDEQEREPAPKIWFDSDCSLA